MVDGAPHQIDRVVLAAAGGDTEPAEAAAAEACDARLDTGAGERDVSVPPLRLRNYAPNHIICSGHADLQRVHRHERRARVGAGAPRGGCCIPRRIAARVT